MTKPPRHAPRQQVSTTIEIDAADIDAGDEHAVEERKSVRPLAARSSLSGLYGLTAGQALEKARHEVDISALKAPRAPSITTAPAGRSTIATTMEVDTEWLEEPELRKGPPPLLAPPHSTMEVDAAWLEEPEASAPPAAKGAPPPLPGARPGKGR